MHPHLPVHILPSQNAGDAKTQCNTTRLGTGSSSRISPSTHTRLFMPTANCWKPTVNSTKRLRRRAEPTSPLSSQQPLQHHPYTLMSCPPFSGVPSVAIPIPLTNVWLWGKSVIHAVATITTLPCANAERTKRPSHDHRSPKKNGRSPRDNRSKCNKDNRHTLRQSPGRCPCHCTPSCSLSHSPSHSAPCWFDWPCYQCTPSNTIKRA